MSSTHTVRRALLVLTVALFALGACGEIVVSQGKTDVIGPGDAGQQPDTSGVECVKNVDCEGGPACALAECVNGECRYRAGSTKECFVDGACYADGGLNPDSACEVCDPASDNAGWSERVCDDNDPLTTDSCDPIQGCLFEQDECPTGYAPPECTECAEGYQDNDADGSCLESCAITALDCGANGTCEDTSGEVVCACEAGYSGANCGGCAAGYQDNDADGSCLESCAITDLECGDNGSCEDVSGEVRCVCESGYAGDTCGECDDGYQDNDGDGSCLESCATANLPCGDNGSCEDVSGEVHCVCESGYVGDTCGECDDGYQDNDGDGSCLESCATANLPCGPTSECSDADGQAVCACLEGYVGDACDECAEGYQDNDGDQTCMPTCATAQLDCGEGGACTDASGTASCTCGAGYQDNDGDGSCLPGCALVAAACSDNSYCVDESGVAECVCDDGYQDNDGDGTCLANCEASAMGCGGGWCDDASGVPTCVCDDQHAGTYCELCVDGLQDNDDDGSCLPTCETAALGCGPGGPCSDAEGTATCVCAPGHTGPTCTECEAGWSDDDGDLLCTTACDETMCGAHAGCAPDGSGCACVAGYVDDGTGCEWGGVLDDPDFMTDGWDTTGTATEIFGVGMFGTNDLCGAGSFSQTFEMPAWEDAEPLVLHIQIESGVPEFDCWSYDLVPPAVFINGSQVPLSFQCGYGEDLVVCLGPEAYGQTVTIEIVPDVAENPECYGSQYFDGDPYDIEYVNIEPDSTGQCFSDYFGDVVNGDFENGTVGWQKSGGSNTFDAIPGAGPDGSTAGRLYGNAICDPLGVTGSLSVPASYEIDAAALQVWWQGPPNEWLRMTLSDGAQYHLEGSGNWMERRFCIPDWSKGMVQSLGFSGTGMGGACAAEWEEEWLFDNIAVVHEPACAPGADLIDGGFEVQGPPPELINGGWGFEAYVHGGTSAHVDGGAGVAFEGLYAAFLEVFQPCRSARFRRTFRVPEAAPGAGPALTYRYFYPVQNLSSFTVSLEPGGGLPAVPDWTQRVVCLPAESAGAILDLEFSLNGGGGSCQTTYTPEILWIDDVRATTDASCPD